MAAKPSKEFNAKAKTYLYAVAAAPRKKGKKSPATDFSAAAEKMMGEIRKLAAREGFKDVQLKRDDGSLGKLGIFFMNAPEKFAAIVRKTEGVHSVEKSGNSARKSIPSGLRKGR